MRIINKGIFEDLVFKCNTCGCAFEIEADDMVSVTRSNGKPYYIYVDCPMCSNTVGMPVNRMEVTKDDKT